MVTLIARTMATMKISKIGSFEITPIVTAFLSTVVSGGIFITLLWQIAGLPNNVYLFVIWPAVLAVAAVNAAITPILYIPAQKMFATWSLMGVETQAPVINAETYR